MKTLLLLILFLAPASEAQLLFDTAYVIFHGDTTEIWQKGERNCASHFVTETSLANDTLYMIQTDTSSLHAMCDCYFTMRTTVIGLPPGSYHGMFYFRQLKKYFPWLPNDTTWLYSSIDFTVSNPSTSAFAQSFRQSTCNGSLDAVQPPSHSILPVDLRLSIFPNPFNPETTIEYWVPRTSHVTLEVFNILGQRVADLLDENQSPGVYRVRFSAGELSSGTYVCRLRVGTKVTSRRFSAVR